MSKQRQKGTQTYLQTKLGNFSVEQGRAGNGKTKTFSVPRQETNLEENDGSWSMQGQQMALFLGRPWFSLLATNRPSLTITVTWMPRNITGGLRINCYRAWKIRENVPFVTWNSFFFIYSWRHNFRWKPKLYLISGGIKRSEIRDTKCKAEHNFEILGSPALLGTKWVAENLGSWRGQNYAQQITNEKNKNRQNKRKGGKNHKIATKQIKQ